MLVRTKGLGGAPGGSWVKEGAPAVRAGGGRGQVKAARTLVCLKCFFQCSRFIWEIY